MLAISTHNIPANIYADKVVFKSKEIYNNNNKDSLMDWYNSVTVEANSDWCKYINYTFCKIIRC